MRNPRFCVVLLSFLSLSTGGSHDSTVTAQPSGNRAIPFHNPTARINDRFASAVSLSPDRIVIGAYAYDDSFRGVGRAYIFSVKSRSLLRTLSNPSPATNDFFGVSTAVVGSRAAIGTVGDDETAQDGGAVYLFDTNDGSIQHTFKSPHPSPRGWFGVSVAMTSDQILVGALGDEIEGIRAGAAYLFDVHTGELLSTFTSPSADPGDSFGASVALSEDRVLIGSTGDDTAGDMAGSAYLFDKLTGTLIQSLPNPSPSFDARFGQSTALSGDLAAVGSYDSSEVYLFDALSGVQVQRISSSSGEGFGRSLSLFGDQIVIGSPTFGVGEQDKIGRATLYDSDTGTILESYENLYDLDDNSGGSFGTSVSLVGSQILIGAPFNQQGSAYLFSAP